MMSLVQMQQTIVLLIIQVRIMHIRFLISYTHVQHTYYIKQNKHVHYTRTLFYIKFYKYKKLCQIIFASNWKHNQSRVMKV